VLVIHAPAQCFTGPLDFAVLSHPGLEKNCQEDDPSTWGNPVRDPHRLSIKMEAQLT
jgi:hypothetical protein